MNLTIQDILNNAYEKYSNLCTIYGTHCFNFDDFIKYCSITFENDLIHVHCEFPEDVLCLVE